jgi:lipopolysaccharide/colanic/teichoic acid biosynthesis glycosyltransferase
VRKARQHQLSGRIEEQGGADQIGRLADMAIAGALLAVTSTLMLIVALAIKWESPGPILHRQTCIGRGGRRFQMLKFRTVVHDREHMKPMWARNTTQVGQFLRLTRIDALPQLVNVLRGEMSVIDSDGSSPSFLD